MLEVEAPWDICSGPIGSEITSQLASARSTPAAQRYSVQFHLRPSRAGPAPFPQLPCPHLLREHPSL